MEQIVYTIIRFDGIGGKEIEGVFATQDAAVAALSGLMTHPEQWRVLIGEHSFPTWQRGSVDFISIVPMPVRR